MADDKKLADSKSVIDSVAWFSNVSTSVIIVFVNKALMDKNGDYRYVFATTLCAFHFLSCAVSIWVAQVMGFADRARMPLGDTILFSVVANVSIASLNVSLLVNSVGFYQIAKLLIIPFVCCVELFWMKRAFTPEVTACVATVFMGVAIVTVTDMDVNTFGMAIAAVSVVSSGMQQIMCGTMQRKHGLSSHQLLSNTAPMQGCMLLLLGPYMDHAISGRWVMGYEYSVPALLMLCTSCSVAVLVNISQFACLGRFSAVTFQVLGHTKTVLVLLISWLYLGEHMSLRKLLGIVLAVAGMAGYGYFTQQQSKPLVARKADPPKA